MFPIIPIVALLVPIVIVPTIMMTKLRIHRMRLEHLERLKALDHHMQLPARGGFPGMMSVTAVGAGVPAVSVLGAIVTTLLADTNRSGDIEAVYGIAWGSATLISAMALLTCLKLASIHRDSARSANDLTGFNSAKPAFDPDAFDVVSSRN